MLIDRLLEGELDLAFVVGTTVDERFERTHLCDDPFVVISACGAGPDGPSIVGRRARTSAPLIGQNDSSCQARSTAGCGPPGSSRPTCSGPTTTAPCRPWSGWAWAGPCCRSLAVDPTDPDVVVQDLDPPIPPRTISIVRRVGRTLPPAAERFIEIAVEVCAELEAQAWPALAGR